MAVSSPTQSSPTPTTPRIVGARRTAAGSSAGGAALRAAPLYLSLGVAAIVLALGAATLVLGLMGRGEIYHGVQVGSLDIGGQSRRAAAADLDAWHAAWASQPVTLHDEATGRDVTATPEELGVALDTEAMLDRAWAYGRDGSLWERSRDWIVGVVEGESVSAVYSVDVDQFSEAMRTLSAEVISAPRNAELVRRDDGTLGIASAEPGVALDATATLAALQDWLTSGLRGDIALHTVSVPPATSDPALEAILDDARAMADDDLKLTLDSAGTTWAIPSDALFSMVRVDVSESPATFTFDERALRGWISSLEDDVHTEPVNANVTLTDGRAEVTPAANGITLDVSATLKAAVAALEAGDTSVALVVDEAEPQLTTATANAAAQQAEQLLGRGASVTHNGTSYALPEPLLRRSLSVTVDPAAAPSEQIRFAFDRNVIAPALGSLAEAVLVPAVDADLRWISDKVEVRTPETPGVELDRDATLANLETALLEGRTESAAVTKVLQAQVRADMAGSIQIKDKLGETRSEYGSSSADRLYNVQLATDRVNGALVPPGGTFSFNRSVGAVTRESGYRTGYGIVGGEGGSIMTIPSVGGGICQVATMVFQSAFYAGMPIETRTWHLYWIPRYGQEPWGMKGLDATVEPDYGLDFNFKNTSDNWVAIKANYDGSNLNFGLWGTATGWEVTIDDPVITNNRPASSQMFYEDSPELPRGTSVFVEHAEDGFDAAIRRVVKKDGQVIEERTFISTYAPARNLTLVGTGT